MSPEILRIIAKMCHDSFGKSKEDLAKTLKEIRWYCHSELEGKTGGIQRASKKTRERGL